MQETMDNSQFRLVEMLLKCSIIIKKISDALLILLAKRSTLEEKMIQTYFIELACVQGKFTDQILTSLERQDKRFSEELLTNLERLANSICDCLDQFLKAAKYDLNYLEQYFEHGFCSSLKSSNYLEDSLKLFASLPSADTSAQVTQ